MDAVKFLKERDRMCDSYGSDSCGTCKISKARGAMRCYDFQKKHPERAVEIVEGWSEEHPEETYLTQFLKYYPNALMTDNGIPKLCVNVLGLEKDGECSTILNCIDCWNRRLRDSEKNNKI